MDFVFTNYLSAVYPTLEQFKAALCHLDVQVITNDLILDSKYIPYFVVMFRSESPTYTEWVTLLDAKEPIIVSGEHWSYKAL